LKSKTFPHCLTNSSLDMAYLDERHLSETRHPQFITMFISKADSAPGQIKTSPIRRRFGRQAQKLAVSSFRTCVTSGLLKNYRSRLIGMLHGGSRRRSSAPTNSRLILALPTMCPSMRPALRASFGRH
jgi:hypothetical protein